MMILIAKGELRSPPGDASLRVARRVRFNKKFRSRHLKERRKLGGYHHFQVPENSFAPFQGDSWFSESLPDEPGPWELWVGAPPSSGRRAAKLAENLFFFEIF